jgi:hypothetical protein
VSAPKDDSIDVVSPAMRGWDRRRTLTVVLVAVYVLVTVALFVYAAARDTPTEADVWFSAIGAGFAVVGVFGAAYAVYRSDVLEKPKPRVWVEVPKPDGADGYDQVDGNMATVAGRVVRVGQPARRFVVRIHVVNEGLAVLLWGKLNIQTLRDCDMEPLPLDTGPSDHHKALTPFNSGELRPGHDVLCNATRSEREYAPGHSYLYLVQVTVPHPGVWPIAAVLDGWSANKRVTRAWTRADLTVT